MLQREEVTSPLREALLHNDAVLALCEGGAAAFSRADEWSDIDLNCIVRDGVVEPVFNIVENTLAELSAIETVYTIPQPTWHGHAQKFYRLADASPFLLIDLTIVQQSAPNKFLEQEIHGNAVVHFDKAGIVASVPPIDRSTFAEMLWSRVETLRTTFPLFQCLTLKEAHRGNAVESLTFYHNFTLAPLVELLRIQHAPFHYNFRSRYLYYDLPRDIMARVEDLYFVSDIADMVQKHTNASAWFSELAESITRETIATAMQ